MENRLIVLEDSSQSGFGGGQRITLEVLNHAKFKNRVILIDSIPSPWHDQIKNREIETIILCNQKIAYQKIFFSIVFLFRSFLTVFNLRPAAIYVTTRKQFLPAFLYKVLSPKTNIVYHEHLIATKSVFVRVFDTIVNKVSRKMIFSSDYTRNEYKKKRNFLNTFHSYVSPLPPRKFEMEPSTLSKLPHNPFIIANVGRISQEKGAIFFFDVLSKLPDEFEWKAIIAGSGPQTSLLLSEIWRLKLGSKVNFLGRVETDLQFYRKISLILVPSFWIDETLCLTAIEAMQVGIPVLVANNGNLANFVTDGSAYGMNKPDAEEASTKIMDIYVKCLKDGFKRELSSGQDDLQQNFQNFYTEVFS